MRPYRVAFEHPTQLLASTFLRALAENNGPVVWERLSRESRGLLEGRYAAGARIALHRAASIEADGADARLAEVVGPVRESALGVLGGAAQLLSLGVSAARLVDRGVAYVLLLPEFGEERIVAADGMAPRAPARVRVRVARVARRPRPHRRALRRRRAADPLGLIR